MRPETQTIPDVGHPRRWWAMLGVCLSVFMSTLDVSIINVSLPTLIEELHTDFPTIQWVIVSYVLCVTCLLLTMGRLGDMVGKTRLYIFGLGLFTVGSLCCGLAPSVGWLIAFRAAQGIGAAITQSLGSAIVVEVFPARDRGQAMGIIGGMVSVGLAVGPAMGGLMIGLFGWRSIFLVNVPVGILALVILLITAPKLAPAEKREKFDPAGAIIMFLALGCYALGLTVGQHMGFFSPAIIGLFFAAVVFSVIFIKVEQRISHPMLDLSLFKNMYFSLNLLMGWLIFLGLGGQFIIPFYLELVKKYPTTTVGALMMVVPAVMGLTSILSGVLSDRLGSRGISLAGLVISVAGCLCLSTLDQDTSMFEFVLLALPFGLGMGLFMSPNNSAIMGSVPKHRLGVAGGLMALSRTLGNATGIPLIGAIYATMVMSASGQAGALNVSAPPFALVYGQSTTYLITSSLVTISMIIGTLILLQSLRQRKAKDSTT